MVFIAKVNNFVVESSWTTRVREVMGRKFISPLGIARDRPREIKLGEVFVAESLYLSTTIIARPMRNDAISRN